MVGEIMTGGCLCGAVRVRAAGEPLWVIYCHCRDCRKASGAPVMAFAGYREERVEVEGTPAVYRSSPRVRRAFCGGCGTSISYKDERLPGEVYLAIGIFDEPERLEPEKHSWHGQKIGWFEISDHLPRFEQTSRPR